MRPTTPKLNLAQQAYPPSSPPQTPTNLNGPRFNNRRNGMFFKPMLAKIDQSITPHGDGPTFSYTPFSKLNPADFSPRSSSSDSSRASSPINSDDEDSDSEAPHSLSSSPAAESPPVHRTRARIVAANLATFTVEEYTSDSDISESDSVFRPYAYEDAESERAASVSSKSRKRDEVDTRLLNKMKELDCDEGEDREAWVEAMRKEKRRKRRSSSSVQKRTLSMSIGSDTDDEDLKPLLLDANEAGSSARRLRRKVGERVSLIFDDPPARIDEEDEGPESVEEVLEVDEDENLGRELPYWEYVQDMDVDSEEDEDEDEDEDDDEDDDDDDE